MLIVAMQVAGIGLTLVAALLIARGVGLITPEVLARLTQTRLDYNSAAVLALSSQVADARVGFLLLAMGAALQFASLVFGYPGTPMTWDGAAGSLPGVVIGLVVSVTAYVLGVRASTKVARHLNEQVMQLHREGSQP